MDNDICGGINTKILESLIPMDQKKNTEKLRKSKVTDVRIHVIS